MSALYGASDRVPIRPRLRLSREARRVRNPVPGRSLARTLVPSYQRFYNGHVAEVEGSTDTPRLKRHRTSRLQDSVIRGVSWSGLEKEQFFKSLARRGRRDVPAIVSDLSGTKSVLEVATYLVALQSHLTALTAQLDRDSASSRNSSMESLGLVSYHNLPMAWEVPDNLLVREMVLSDELITRSTEQFHTSQTQIMGWSWIDSRTAAEISQHVEVMAFQDAFPPLPSPCPPSSPPAKAVVIQEAIDRVPPPPPLSGRGLDFSTHLDLLYRTVPDLVTIDTAKLLALVSSRKDGEQEEEDSSLALYKSTSEAIYKHVGDVLTRVMATSMTLAQARARVERGEYFSAARFRGREDANAGDGRNNHDGRDDSSKEEDDDDDDDDENGSGMVIDTDVRAACQVLGMASDVREMLAQRKSRPQATASDHRHDADSDDEDGKGEGKVDSEMDDDDDDDEEGEMMDDLLDKHDAHQALLEQASYRSFMGLLPSAVPSSSSSTSTSDRDALTSAERKRLTQLLARERARRFDSVDVSPESDAEVESIHAKE